VREDSILLEGLGGLGSLAEYIDSRMQLKQSCIINLEATMHSMDTEISSRLIYEHGNVLV